MKNQDVLSKNKQQKAGVIAEIADKANASEAMVFADFGGLTHKQLEDMKRTIKKSGASFVVVKNTLLKRALADTPAKDAVESQVFEGQTGALFLTKEVVEPLKTVSKMVKDLEKPKIKFGILSGKVISDKEVLKLATLPSKETLLTQLVGTLKSPIFGLHRSLNWNMQKFVMTLNAVASKKS